MIDVLIVEDSQAVKNRLIKFIERLPDVNILKPVGAVAEAFASLEVSRPQVLILDIGLPDGSGLELLQKIREGCGDTVIIILTNYATPQMKQEGLRQGADYFFDKSSEFKKALDVIEEIARRKS